MSFITEIAPFAQRIQMEYDILTSLIIAQAIHESNWGKSGLAVKGKNLFGIKGSYNGQSVTMRSAEYDRNGNKYYIDAIFRKYPTWYESLLDLANLYKNGVSWDRNKYNKIIGETDYKKAAKAVQAAGYASDPNYATKIINIIESNKLFQYDEGGKKPPQPSKDEKYTVNNSLGGYLTAADAKLRKNKKSTVKPDTYYVYNKSDGMINVTKVKGFPGSWINPSDNKKKKTNYKYHTVVKGDTVSALALKYGTTQAKIKKWNKLNSEYTIYVGQKLRVG